MGLVSRWGERLEAFERLEDRAGPGPLGREVQRDPAGVAGELSGDVQDPVAQPFGFTGAVFAVECEQLRPDGDVVRGEGEFEPRGVRVEGVERQVGGAGRFDCLDAILDHGVLAVKSLQRGDVWSGWSVMKHWKRCPSRSVNESCAPGCGRSRRQINRVPSGQSGRLTWPVSSVTHAPSRGSPPWPIAGRQAGSLSASRASRTGSVSW